MRKLSEIKNEDALDFIADIIEPLSRICGDPELAEYRKNGEKITVANLAKWVIKHHKSDVIECLAIIDGEPVEEYNRSVMEITFRVLEIMNDKDLISLFTSQSLTTEKTSSGSATENIEAKEN